MSVIKSCVVVSLFIVSFLETMNTDYQYVNNIYLIISMDEIRVHLDSA